MGRIANAETVLKNAVKRTYGTVRKQRQKTPVFKAWTVAKLLETYKDPRAILLEIASMETAALAKVMNGTHADALAERRLCAQAVLPYVAQKLPAQVDMRLTRAINLNIVDDRQYKELVEIAATEQDDADGFNMQLLPGNADDSSSQQTGSEGPAAPKRDLAWDIQPTPQRNNVAGDNAVTPPVPLPHRRGE